MMVKGKSMSSCEFLTSSFALHHIRKRDLQKFDISRFVLFLLALNPLIERTLSY